MSLFPRSEKRSLSYQDVWGTGKDLSAFRNSERALSLIPVYASIRLIADNIASLPIKQYRKNGDTRMPVPSAAFLQPGPNEPTVFTWIHQAITSLAITGNAVGLIVSLGSDGFPSRIVWVNPSRVSLDNNSTVGDPGWRIDGQSVPWESVIHIPLFQKPGELWGLSPLKQFATTLDVGLMAQEFGRDFFANGTAPSGILATSDRVSAEDASEMKRRFKEASRSHDVAVLGVGVSYSPLAVPPEDAQFVETLSANATLIAAIYGVPPEEVGGSTGDSMTYSNEEQRAIRFTNFTLRPWLVRFESALDTLIPRGQFLKLNIDSMVRTDLQTRYESYRIAREIGLNSIDEIRAREDLAPLPNGAGSQATPLQIQKGAQSEPPSDRT